MLIAAEPGFELSGLRRALAMLSFPSSIVVLATPWNVLTAASKSGITDVSFFGIASELGASARWVYVALMAICCFGRYPRATVPLQWYLTFSLAIATAGSEGGDQIAAVFCLYSLIFTTGGLRAQPKSLSVALLRFPRSYATLTTLLRLQLGFIYLFSAIAKLGRSTWREGSAVYFFLGDSLFGAPGYAEPLLEGIYRHPLPTALLSWVPILIEIGIGGCCILKPILPIGYGQVMFLFGVILHSGIALGFGLVPFSINMVIYLWFSLWRIERPVQPRGREGLSNEHSKDS